jgi:predicted MFS family arabinose efflux permease
MNTPASKPSSVTNNQSTTEKVYLALAIDDDGRLCKDIPESACNHQPKHFLTHVTSLTLSKLADSFVDPKLVLSWLLTQFGNSTTTIGFLVPIRESGALLPQLFFSEWTRTRAQRKWVWAVGAVVQGMAALAMVFCVLFLPKQVAGFGILICLLVLAVARSFCSVSYKDVLGKTLSKATRGAATGIASSIASFGIIAFALLLGLNLIQLSTDSILVLLGIAGGFWIVSAITFTQLNEENGSTEGGKNGAENLIKLITKSFLNKQFLLFVLTRGFLTATALAPPFMILLVKQTSDLTGSSSGIDFLESSVTSFGAEQLGLLMLASALASLFSSFLWGRFADRSSRKVLLLAAFLSSLTLGLTWLIAMFFPSVLLLWYSLPILLFCLMVAYQGVRLGRTTHLVDMATENTRAAYTAVSNSTIGVLLMFGSAFGLLAQLIGVTGVLLVFALMCLFAAAMAVYLDEVQC